MQAGTRSLGWHEEGGGEGAIRSEGVRGSVFCFCTIFCAPQPHPCQVPPGSKHKLYSLQALASRTVLSSAALASVPPCPLSALSNRAIMAVASWAVRAGVPHTLNHPTWAKAIHSNRIYARPRTPPASSRERVPSTLCLICTPSLFSTHSHRAPMPVPDSGAS